jgi:hypothetical protein
MGNGWMGCIGGESVDTSVFFGSRKLCSFFSLVLTSDL